MSVSRTMRVLWWCFVGSLAAFAASLLGTVVVVMWPTSAAPTETIAWMGRTSYPVTPTQRAWVEGLTLAAVVSVGVCLLVVAAASRVRRSRR